jgi:MFS family permease
MHFDTPAAVADDPNARPWFKELTPYHWFVFVVAAVGWLADCMDQQLFNLARNPAIRELRGTSTDLQFYGGLATMIFMLGWATGGVIFGIMGDRVGRAKTMMLTILLYSMFTGLSAISLSFWDFAFYRFLTGLGVGGEFAVGVALLAEVMPDRARPHALGWLQACSALGNVSAAFVGMALSPLEAANLLGDWKPWRYMFVVGALPALLTLLIRRRLKEPARWQALKNAKEKLGSIPELLGTPLWRRHAILGLLLATAGVVGLWGIGFFGFDLARVVFRETFEAETRSATTDQIDRRFVARVVQAPTRQERVKDITEARAKLAMDKVQPTHLLDPESRAVYAAAVGLLKTDKSLTAESLAEALNKNARKTSAAELTSGILATPLTGDDSIKDDVDQITARTLEIESRLTWWASMYGLLFNLGAFFGVYSFSRFTHYMGRRPAFAVTFTLALAATAFAFSSLSRLSDTFWMVPMMGFFQIALFGGYAIYFPELFPTRLRSTGTSFCYNVGRYLAAPGPLLLGTLASMVYGGFGDVLSLRYAGVTMCAFFLLGLAVLPFAPETKGKPLPE